MLTLSSSKRKKDVNSLNIYIDVKIKIVPHPHGPSIKTNKTLMYIYSR